MPFINLNSTVPTGNQQPAMNPVMPSGPVPQQNPPVPQQPAMQQPVIPVTTSPVINKVDNVVPTRQPKVPVEVAPIIESTPTPIQIDPVPTPGIVETNGPALPSLQSSTPKNNFDPAGLGLSMAPVSQPMANVQPNQTIVPQVKPVQLNSNISSIYSPETTDIWSYLDLTEKRDASDLHFTVNYPVMLRVDGKLEPIGSEPLSATRVDEIFKPVMTEEQYNKFLKNKEIDFSVQHKTGSRFRVNLYHERGNIAGAFRLIPSKIKTMSDLGLPEVCENFIRQPNGLVLLTGPTGSGKSTTIAAMLNEINLAMPKHIISIEDPIEYLYGKGTALVDQREVEKDTDSFKVALKSLLRQDPDVVLVGEMRDYETIALTITAAETGHLVFATLHTNSAAQTIDRIIDVFPENQQGQIRAQLAQVLVGVISQRLVPLKGGGRKAVLEILVGNPAVKNAIREGKTYQIDNIIQTCAEEGMFLMEKQLAALVRSGEADLETALEFSARPDQLRDILKN